MIERARRRMAAIEPSRGRRNGAAFVALLALAATSGCSPTKLAVGSMVPVIEEATAAAFASSDPELVRQAIPANLLLLEGLIRTHPKRELMVKAAQFYFSYGFAFVEDEEPERALELYQKGKEHGLGALQHRSGLLDALDAKAPALLTQALGSVSKKDVGALFWAAAAWAGWIQLNLESPSAIADLSLVEPMLERVLELDESFESGMPHLLMGGFWAGRPPILGGDLERGRRHFARAREIARGRSLLPDFFEARYYAVQAFDEPLFVERLTEVLNAPDRLWPEGDLLNRVAKAKAEALLDARADIF